MAIDAAIQPPAEVPSPLAFFMMLHNFMSLHVTSCMRQILMVLEFSPSRNGEIEHRAIARIDVEENSGTAQTFTLLTKDCAVQELAREKPVNTTLLYTNSKICTMTQIRLVTGKAKVSKTTSPADGPELRSRLSQRAMLHLCHQTTLHQVVYNETGKRAN